MFVGCGAPTDKHEVAGHVTLDGVAISTGSIRFVPSEETGTSAGTTIEQGEYLIPGEKGLRVGKYRVVISAADSSVPEVSVQGQAPVARELVPPRYNINSELQAEVTEEGENRFDFSLDTAHSEPSS
jgi:hypothetical protein